ncbi:MAG: fibronectin type III domain-containing protein [Planctomycetota bacterium]|nr:fibronectin type III domain-containing protein [Planctomycetota bacterium]
MTEQLSGPWISQWASIVAEAGHAALIPCLPIAEVLESRLLLSVSVTTYHNDLASTGQNLAETQLTPSNVNAGSFGKLVSTTVDGQVYTQPLVVPGLSVNGGTHDVAFVGTEHDSFYAIDANNGQILWQRSFINPGAGVTTPSSNDVSSTDVAPENGITGTPVIDPSTNTIYFVAMTREQIGGDTHYIYRLHALDISTSAEKFGGPALIGDTISNNGNFIFVSGPSVAGHGDGSVNGVVNFNVVRERQRAALSLVNGTIYIAFASFGDTPPYHGWILGYNSSNLALSAVFCDNPNAGDDGIWGGGGRIASDAQGNLFFETGNGGFDSTLNAAGFPINGDYGDSFVKLSVDSSTAANPNINGWGLKVVDYFAPFNQQSLSNGDTDLGSGQVMLLPDSAGSAAHPHLLIGGGKEGRLYLIDRDNMGHFDPNTDHMVQELPGALGGLLGTAAYFNGQIYITGGFSNDRSHAFTIANGAFSTSAISTPDTFSFPGATPTISANGNSNGIVWDIDRNSAQLRAYDASNYANELYTSAQAPGDRDGLHSSGVKFAVATEANGKVFVGTSNSLVIYGLLAAATTAPAAPTNLSVSAIASGQINLKWTDTANNESGYLVEQSTNGGPFSQIGGTGIGATSFSATKLQPKTSYAFRVRAFNNIGNSDYTNTASATTPIAPPPGVLDFSAGFAAAASLLSINGPQTTVVNSRLRLTDGGTNETTSVFSSAQVDITKFTTQFSFQLTNAQADGFTFAIQNGNLTTVGPGGGALGYGSDPGLPPIIPNSVAIKFDIYDNSGEGTDSTGLYVNGALPTVPSVDLSNTPINLHSGDVMNAALSYDGTNLTVKITDTATGGIAQQSYAINIPQQVNGNTAFVGFTAASGGLGAVQDIISWTYSPNAASNPTVVAPTSFTAGASSGTQVGLNWMEAPGGATNILIERSTSGGPFNQIAALAGNASSFLDTQLMTGTTYAYRLRSQIGSQFSGYTPVQTVATPSLPLPPSNPRTTLVSSGAVSIAWTNNANNAQGYRVYRLSTVGGQFILIATLGPTAQSYNDSGLPSGTTIKYDIEAFNLAGFSAGATLGTTTASAPPTNLLVGSSGGNNTLNWAPSVGAVTYNIYRGTASGGEGSTAYKTGVSSTSFVDSSVNSGTTYFYEVTSVNSNGESGPSNEATTQVGLPAPWANTDIGAPVPAGSAALSAGVFTLTGSGGDIWFASDQFQYTYQSLAGDGTIIARVASVSNTNDWTKAGVMIREALTATANQVSMFLTPVNGVRLQYRNASATQSADVYGNTGVVKSYWVKLVRTGGTVSGFESFDGNSWQAVGGPVNIASGPVLVGLALTSHNAGALATATFDKVSITASATPPTPTPPAASTNLTVAANSLGQPVLTWFDNSTNETGFRIDRATDILFTANMKTVTIASTNPASVGMMTFTDTSAAAGVTYYYRVRATNAVGDSANSNTSVLVAVSLQGSLPKNWNHSDIGSPAVGGSTTFNSANNAFTLTGGGSDIWWSSDQFQYAYQSLAGDGTIIAHVQAPVGTSDWAKAGIMIRQTLAATSTFAMMLISPGHGVHLQSRTLANPNGTATGGAQGVTSYWLKLVRAGGFVTGFQSADGNNWMQVGAAVPMAFGPIFVGLALTSHNNGAATTAVYDHVSVTTA